MNKHCVQECFPCIRGGNGQAFKGATRLSSGFLHTAPRKEGVEIMWPVKLSKPPPEEREGHGHPPARAARIRARPGEDIMSNKTEAAAAEAANAAMRRIGEARLSRPQTLAAQTIVVVRELLSVASAECPSKPLAQWTDDEIIDLVKRLGASAER